MEAKYENYEEENEDEARIEWSNLIFLPFHPFFRLIVLLAVIVKVILGPIQAIYPILYCSDIMDTGYLAIIKYFYWYGCDPIYCVDTVLHIIHRQVTDKAVRREYLPKSGLLIIIDIISLIPFFRLILTEACPPIKLWPNILSFTEFVIIYRIYHYFSLNLTHSLVKFFFGWILIEICALNCLSCLWILLTEEGFCDNCKNNVYDWRSPFLHMINTSNPELATYVFASVYVLEYTSRVQIMNMSPYTILELIASITLKFTSFVTLHFILQPKIFAEFILRLKKIFLFHPHVCRLVAETKRRNQNNQAYIEVKDFYSLMWNKRNGITSVPEMLAKLPRYLRVEIKQDLCWAVFYHSPSLRRTSIAFKRSLCEYIIPDYKLPGSKFFSGSRSITNLYYIKSGIVQIISEDDGSTPILSLTSGTLFGDISFFVPPIKRKVYVRCLTYCEVFFLSRVDYLRVLDKYPEDRRAIIKLAKDRMKHARTLFACKQNVRGIDRSDDENIAWLKKRWWEISVSLENWKKRADKRHDRSLWKIPHDDCAYHCPKYIGQLVICNETQLKTKSLFIDVTFPWILVPDSTFSIIWNKIVRFTIYLVIVLYPAILAAPMDIGALFKFWVNFVYVMDIIVSLMTSMAHKENVGIHFATVMFERCKTLHFALDVLATLWIEHLLVLFGKPQYYDISQLNRLIKMYKLFSDSFRFWNMNVSPMYKIFWYAWLSYFASEYINVFIGLLLKGKQSTAHVLDHIMCSESENCDNAIGSKLYQFILWWLHVIDWNYELSSMEDVIIRFYYWLPYMVWVFSSCLVLAAIYLKYREATNFQEFVSNLKSYYKLNLIHKALLQRLEKYLVCHWKYYTGADIMFPTKLKDEPHDIYWKVQGEVAEKIIGESLAFKGASPYLIRELAYAAKFLILPSKSTIFLFGVQCNFVSWIVHGKVKCEYHDENGILSKTYHDRGYMLSASSVFFGKTSLRTYTAVTDCETLYLKIQDFFKIIKRHPSDWSHFETCISEFSERFDSLHETYMSKYDEYRVNLRRRIFQAKASTVSPEGIKVRSKVVRRLSSLMERARLVDTESIFLRSWMIFRLITVCLSIVSAALQGGSGAVFREPFYIVEWICYVVSWLDIIGKFKLPYYDHHGILISNTCKCAVHYVSRGFLMDVIGAFPWSKTMNYIFSQSIDQNLELLINTLCKFSHLYLVIGYFDYYADSPSICVYILIIKWFLVYILARIGISHYFMYYCVAFTFDNDLNLLDMNKKRSCWLPGIFNISHQISTSDLHLIYAQSLYLDDLSINIYFKDLHFDVEMITVFFMGLIIIYIYWAIFLHGVTLLLLHFRGNIVFQHGVTQLHKFLSAERVDKDVIKKAVFHFAYWWKRTNGINIQHLTNERLGVVFRQDLNYFFYQKTFTALDTLIKGGKSLERELASNCATLYILPGCDIIREMDLTTFVYVIHRGIVDISQDGEPVAKLTRGCIFGQLDGTTSRPVRITATAESYVDLLTINVNLFQELIDDTVRKTIRDNPQSSNDYMATKKLYREEPRDTIEYIRRRRQCVQFPWMRKVEKIEESVWYTRWLYVAWFIEPVVSSFIALLLVAFDEDTMHILYLILLSLDALHLMYLIVEYYTLQLTVVKDKCVPRIIGNGLFKHWFFYVGILSIIVPLLTIVTAQWMYQLVRLVRLKLLYDFYRRFGTGFKSRFAPILMKIVIFILIIHSLTCGWILVACRNDVFPFPVNEDDYKNVALDRGEWILPNERKGGCAKIAIMNTTSSDKLIFVVPKNPYMDYVIALVHIFFTMRLTKKITMALTTIQIYYLIYSRLVSTILHMWVFSFGISFVYTRLRDLYSHDYNERRLLDYLRKSGLSPPLVECFKDYTKQLWRRQRGNWLPELALTAPICLKEDILCALYMHHLETPDLFRRLPKYFLRQLAARLKRIVVFPDKLVVEEGDVFPCIYFIHEGEVEKWWKNSQGEYKLVNLLTTNGYFGLIPGLFSYVPFQYTYRTRTVVDFVVLTLTDWKDLLRGYPDIKKDLYAAASQFKKQVTRS